METAVHPIFQRINALELHPCSADWQASVREYASAAALTYGEASAEAYEAVQKAYQKWWAFGVDCDDSEPFEGYEPDYEAPPHRIWIQ